MDFTCLGAYRQLVVARSTSERVLAVAQDGGVVTTILQRGLHEDFDGALICKKDSQWRPLPGVGATAEDILQGAGSSYVMCPTLSALRAVPEGMRLALVGTPCQVNALRRLQDKGDLRALQVKLAVGLFCSHSFSYEGLIEAKLRHDLGLKPEEIRKMNIKGRFLIELFSGETKELPLKELRPYVRPACTRCHDFTGEKADISVGAVGLDGKNFVIVRTALGKALLDRLEGSGQIETYPVDLYQKELEVLVRLALKKRTIPV
ncbi:MAG TPA: hypothetical protein GXX50_02425 [Firmicutes bacterium]|nr:hypothetical protein [Bacillota bacterium]